MADPAHDKAAREHHGQIFAARTRTALSRGIGCCGHLAYRNSLAGQQGFVCRQTLCDEQARIGRHPVTFGQHDEIATHHFPSRDPLPLSTPDHQGARACQIAQRLEHAFRSRLLHDGDPNRQAGKGQEDERLFQVAEQKIDDAAHDQQRQHRLSQDLKHDPDRGPAPSSR